jgi:hypothetical protein
VRDFAHQRIHVCSGRKLLEIDTRSLSISSTLAGFEGILYISLFILCEAVRVGRSTPATAAYSGLYRCRHCAGTGGSCLGAAGRRDYGLIQIGVLFLFFMIGLEEIDIPSIFSVLQKRHFACAMVGFAVPVRACRASALFLYRPWNDSTSCHFTRYRMSSPA